MEESIIKDKKYLTGLLVGFVLAAVIMIGVNRYQDKGVSVDENGNVQDKQEEVIVNEQEEIINDVKGSVEKTISEENGNGTTYDDLLGVTSNNPEAPHSPELQRLDIILRETNKIVERMGEDFAKINETQTANISQ